MKVLIAPDKFKGTLTAHAAANAIARGWRKGRPDDELELLPITDGGDGFGEVMSELLGARAMKCKTVDAAHRPCNATWWWDAKTRMAIIESANIIGLAMLPPGKFHPFDLDTFGLGKVIRTAQTKGAKQILIGIGGSATNDGGFGLARALGWKFLDARGEEITRWTKLEKLREIRLPAQLVSGSARVSRAADGVPPSASSFSLDKCLRRDAANHTPEACAPQSEIIVAVDVQNPLFGLRGATRVYGPQKGLRPQDFALAETCLRKLTKMQGSGVPVSKIPGSGAAGGLGFGLMTFLGAKLEPGFDLFAQRARLLQRLRRADLVITGEGAIDRSTFMGKGVGEIARCCRQLKIPCLGLGGRIEGRVKKYFAHAAAITDLIDVQAKRRPAWWLSKITQQVLDSPFFAVGRPNCVD